MDLDSLPNYLLGQTNELLTCTGDEENRLVTIAMLMQAERHIDILSSDLEPRIYNNQECADALEHLALLSRHSRIRILLRQPRQIAERGHHILTLGRHLNSVFKFRKLSEKHQSFEECFLIADESGLIHYPYPDSLKSFVNFNDVLLVKKFSSVFNELWEEAEPDPYTTSWIL